jgi:hypothetical protein
MLAHLMATTVQTGLWAEYLSALVRGITGVIVDIGVAVDTGVMADITGARAGVTAMSTMDAAMPVTTLAAVTDTHTLAADSTVAEKSAAAGSTVEAEVDSTVAADRAADTGKLRVR